MLKETRRLLRRFSPIRGAITVRRILRIDLGGSMSPVEELPDGLAIALPRPSELPLGLALSTSLFEF